MGLATEIPTDYGVMARYFNMLDVAISFREGKVSVSMNGFASQELRDANAAPIKAAAVTLAIGEVKAIPRRTRQVGNPEFMPEGQTEVVDEASFVPFLPLEVMQAFQSALYTALKGTDLFGDAVDA